MSGLMDKAKDMAGQHEDKQAQPGDSVEKSADQGANNEINQAAGDAGVPQGADKMIDNAADQKINSDIPGGNN